MIATVLVEGAHVSIAMITQNGVEVMKTIMMIIPLGVDLEVGIEAVVGEMAGVGGMITIGSGAETGMLPQMEGEVDREVLEAREVLGVLVDMEVGET